MSTRGIPVNGDTIRRLREAKGWTQERLGNEVELSKKTIENAETGRTITATTLERIARGLGTDAKSLLKGVPEWLRDWPCPFGALIEDKTRGFVGRDFVFKAIDGFLSDTRVSSGYFVIRGEPGIGKSAIVSELVKRADYVHHFNSKVQGINKPRDFINNVCAQIIVRFDLSSYSEPPQDAQGGGVLLNRVLHDASTKRRDDEQLVIAIDALDEVDQPGTSENVLFLPPSLPPSVFVLATTRYDLRLQVAQLRLLELVAQSADNLEDMRKYIQAQLQLAGIKRWVKRKGLDHRSFVDELLVKSAGNFMYVYYVLTAIANGGLDETNVDELPQGLREYYRGHWNKMQNRDPAAFNGIYKPVLCVLAAALEAVSVHLVGERTGIKTYEVQKVLRDWREFLYEERNKDGDRVYRLYHSSFQEFLQEEVDPGLRSARSVISDPPLEKMRCRKRERN